jgi:cytochrome c oxidase assembly factor CtaG
VPVEYYALMFAYLLTPAYSLSLHNEFAHIVAHMLFLLCGVMFWVPVIGRDPTGWRPTDRTRVLLVAAGLPIGALLAVADARWSLLVMSEGASAFGLGLVLLLVHGRTSRARVRARARVRPQALPVPAARS